MLLLTAHQFLRIHVPGVHQLLAGQQLLLRKTLLDARGHRHIRLGGDRSLDVGNERGLSFLATLGEMHLVAYPTLFALSTVLGFGIVRGGDQLAGGRQFLVLARTQALGCALELLRPDLTQRLHCGGGAHQVRGAALHSGEQAFPVAANLGEERFLSLAGDLGKRYISKRAS